MVDQVEPRVPLSGTVTWPKGTSIIQVIVEPGKDVTAIRAAIVDGLARKYTSGVIVEEAVSVDV